MEQALWPGKVLNQLSGSGFTARLQECEWPNPNSFQFRCNETTLVLALTPLPKRRKSSLSVNGRSSQFVDAGEMVLMPAGVVVQADAAGGTQRCLSLTIAAQQRELPEMPLQELDGPSLGSCLDLRSDALAHAMHRLSRELPAPGLAAETLLEALGMYVSIEVGRMFSDAPVAQSVTRGGLAPWQVKRIADFVSSRLAQAPSVSELSSVCGISRRHLTRAFKQATGETLFAYIERVRLGEARRLLMETRLPLKVIAARLGYAKQSSFSVAFRRASGDMPSRFRSENTMLSRLIGH